MSPERKPSNLPDYIPDVARETVNDAIQKLNEGNGEYSRTPYGHAAGMLAQIAVTNKNPEQSLSTMRAYALKLIEEYGPDILQVMRPELIEALKLEE